MVCLGNICRSPMAEVVARTLVRESGFSSEVHVESFGTAGYHVGRGADPRADAALGRAGWPASGHVVRRLDAGALASLDLVCCADAANLADVRRLAARAPADPRAGAGRIRLLRSFDPEAPEGAEVPDPFAGGASDFDAALVLIEAACRGLVAGLVADLVADRRRSVDRPDQRR